MRFKSLYSTRRSVLDQDEGARTSRYKSIYLHHKQREIEDLKIRDLETGSLRSKTYDKCKHPDAMVEEGSGICLQCGYSTTSGALEHTTQSGGASGAHHHFFNATPATRKKELLERQTSLVIHLGFNDLFGIPNEVIRATDGTRRPKQHGLIEREKTYSRKAHETKVLTIFSEHPNVCGAIAFMKEIHPPTIGQIKSVGRKNDRTRQDRDRSPKMKRSRDKKDGKERRKSKIAPRDDARRSASKLRPRSKDSRSSLEITQDLALDTVNLISVIPGTYLITDPKNQDLEPMKPGIFLTGSYTYGMTLPCLSFSDEVSEHKRDLICTLLTDEMLTEITRIIADNEEELVIKTRQVKISLFRTLMLTHLRFIHGHDNAMSDVIKTGLEDGTIYTCKAEECLNVLHRLTEDREIRSAPRGRPKGGTGSKRTFIYALSKRLGISMTSMSRLQKLTHELSVLDGGERLEIVDSDSGSDESSSDESNSDED